MKTQFAKLTVLLLSVAMLAACGKKSNSGTSVTGGTGTWTSGPSNLPYVQNSVAGQTPAYVTSNDPTGNLITEVVKVLVSPSVDPNSVGTVNAQTGIQIYGRAIVDRNTGAVNSASQIQLVISDSWAGQQDGSGHTIPPITIQVAGASGGASNGQANLSFRDSVGVIRITGTYDATSFRGHVAFDNNTKGYNGKSGGELGDFVISTCSFFSCQ